jgi:peptidyl-prolyl cis-trans isomerase-like protein 2
MSLAAAAAAAGNVYSYDALDELCIKPKNWKDLLTDEPFTRKDIIHLQVGVKQQQTTGL